MLTENRIREDTHENNMTLNTFDNQLNDEVVKQVRHKKPIL